jgi:hypothetical protein
VDVNDSQLRDDPARVNDSARSSLQIFINYRHEDTQGTAFALYFKLVERFGRDNVFFDNGTLRPGTHWFEEIKSHVATAGAFISLIGTEWMPTLIERQRRGGEDYVCTEIDLALRSGPQVTVIPVLLDSAGFPDRQQLPPALEGLLSCQGTQLRHTHLEDDIDNLMSRLAELERAATPIGAGSQMAGSGETPSRKRIVRRRRRISPGPDADHYRRIVEHADNLVVFLGAGANAEDGGLPDDHALARSLAAHLDRVDSRAHLAEIAQHVRAMYGQSDLFEWLREALSVESEPGAVHKGLADLPAKLGGRYQMIVTPKYDAMLERAFREANEEFDVAMYMAPGTDEAGKFVHLPWCAPPQAIREPSDYMDFPIAAVTRKLQRTVIVRTNGAVDDLSPDFPVEGNYVVTEDHGIEYMSGLPTEKVVPTQILAKLRKASYLFLGYTIADWRLRVFLRRIWGSSHLDRAKYWAVEPEPDALERDLWQQWGVTLYQSSLTEYLAGLHEFVGERAGRLS